LLKGTKKAALMSLFHRLFLFGAQPKNKLEENLLAFLKDRLEPAQFEASLKASRVAILVKDNPAEGAKNQIRPLVIDGAGGHPALCVFTHLDRAAGMQKSAPAYAYAMETEFTYVLSITPPGFGMAMNAGTLFSTELTPEGVDALRGS
jgi:hypothetical protein